MKKLNKKGFTLIELLAVIVILAIIVVVTVPSIISSINNARLSSLHSLAKEVASWYDNSLAQDELGLGSNILNGLRVPDDNKWHCLHDLDGDGDPEADDSLADIYGLSEVDIYLKDEAPKVNFYDNVYYWGFYDDDDDYIGILSGHFFPIQSDTNPETLASPYCSSIAIKEGKTVVLLFATDGGKFDTNGLFDSYAVTWGKSGYDYEV